MLVPYIVPGTLCMSVMLVAARFDEEFIERRGEVLPRCGKLDSRACCKAGLEFEHGLPQVLAGSQRQLALL